MPYTIEQLQGQFGAPATADHVLQFIAQHLPYAEAIARKRGVDPRAILGQMALESNYGRASMSANGAGNFGNVNEVRADMPGVWVYDKDANGKSYRVKRRVFSGPADFYRYYDGLFDQGLSSVAGVQDPREFARRMYQAGYAEDKNYEKLVGQDMFNTISRRIPKYQFDPQRAGSTLDELAGNVNSANWGADGASAYARTNVRLQPKQVFGLKDTYKGL